MNTSEHKDFINPSPNNLKTNKLSYGNYKMFYKKQNIYKIAIGPHWYISIIGLLSLTGISFAPILKIYKYLSYPLLTIYIILLLCVISFYLLTILKNPGVVPRIFWNKDTIDEIEKNERYDCLACKRVVDEDCGNIGHCWECDICIKGLDHHCIWMGKCVGKGNLKFFYAFVISVPVFFAYMMFVTVVLRANVK